MAFKFGKDSVFKIDDIAGSLTAITANVESVDGLPGGVETGDTTQMGASARGSIPGLKMASKVGIAGKFDATASTNAGRIFNDHYNNGGALSNGGSVSIEYDPQGTASGTPKMTAEVWVTNYTVTSQLGSVVAYKADLEVTGGVTVASN